MGLMEMKSNYYKPTPKKWRKIGDTILLGTASLSVLIMGSPLSDHAKAWIVFFSNALGIVGKVLTNFFKEDSAKK
jgi:hypothetical protein